jgi:hypothetical protein
MNIMQWVKREPRWLLGLASTCAAVAFSLAMLSGCVSCPKVPQILQVPESTPA